jgi:hypothetical protein
MRIESDDKTSFIELERRDEGGFLVLAAHASIGEFTARNRSAIIADAPAFLRDMAAFEASRSGAIALCGTEQEFELRIRAYDRQGHLWVGASIARRHFISRPENVEPLQFSGGFLYDAEYAAQLFVDLRELLREAA